MDPPLRDLKHKYQKDDDYYDDNYIIINEINFNINNTYDFFGTAYSGGCYQQINIYLKVP